MKTTKAPGTTQSSAMQENTHKTHLQDYMDKRRIASKVECSTRSQARKGSGAAYKAIKPIGHGTSKRGYKSPGAHMGGRLSINDILTEDELLYIFSLLNTSDLLRAVVVCKLWKEMLNNSDLWRVAFRRLPRKVQALSENVKKPKEINWKKELIYCGKKSLKVTVDKFLLKKVNHLPTKMEEAVRYLDPSWLLLAEDLDHNEHVSSTKEVFFFPSSISIRWNQVNIPALNRIAELKLFALVPVFKSKKEVTILESVCTKSLIQQYHCDDRSLVDAANSSEPNMQVILQFLKDLVIGTWNVSEVAEAKDVAFITCSLNYHDHLIERILYGNSNRQYILPKHIPYEDDIDSTYGLHGYSGTVSIRNNRRTIWEAHYREFFEYKWDDDMFFISNTREDDYSYYDVDKEYDFVWISGAMKGKVKDACIMDVTLIDQNHKVIWGISRPAFMKALERESSEVSYYYEDGEKVALEIKDDSQKVSRITMMKQRGSSRSTVVKVEIGLPKQFINFWFATQY